MKIGCSVGIGGFCGGFVFVFFCGGGGGGGDCLVVFCFGGFGVFLFCMIFIFIVLFFGGLGFLFGYFRKSVVVIVVCRIVDVINV